jgi:hypothetical protein
MELVEHFCSAWKGRYIEHSIIESVLDSLVDMVGTVRHQPAEDHVRAEHWECKRLSKLR